jgi:hypothetical protein
VSIPEKIAKGNYKVAFFRDIGNKSKMREVVDVDPMAHCSLAIDPLYHVLPSCESVRSGGFAFSPQDQEINEHSQRKAEHYYEEREQGDTPPGSLR